jgi:hypothetical protein
MGSRKEMISCRREVLSCVVSWGEGVNRRRMSRMMRWRFGKKRWNCRSRSGRIGVCLISGEYVIDVCVDVCVIFFGVCLLKGNRIWSVLRLLMGVSCFFGWMVLGMGR